MDNKLFSPHTMFVCTFEFTMDNIKCGSTQLTQLRCHNVVTTFFYGYDNVLMQRCHNVKTEKFFIRWDNVVNWRCKITLRQPPNNIKKCIKLLFYELIRQSKFILIHLLLFFTHKKFSPPTNCCLFALGLYELIPVKRKK